MGWDSDGTSEPHEEWFEGGRRSVYKESVVGVGGFPFLLSLLVLLYSKASYDFETASTLVLSGSPRNEFRAFCLVLFSVSHSSYQYHLRPTPPVTLERVLQYCTWYWMCLHPSTGCKYCSEPCSVFGITFELSISRMPVPARYTRTSLTTSYLILKVPASLNRV